MSNDAPTVHCVRLDHQGPAPRNVDYGGVLGDEIRNNICDACWQEWSKMEVMVINELKLNFMDPKSLEILSKHMREFLCLDGSGGSLPSEVTENMKPIEG